jgi:hypothetical protein
MNDESKEKQTMLGFLGFFETIDRQGYLGAILISDLQGIPQEFRCTHPVKPTIIQKPLYGDTLEPYIGVNLCGIPLAGTIQNKPSLIVVHKEFLLDVRKEGQWPVIFVRRAGEAIDIKSSVDLKVNLKRERLDCPTGKFQPIIFASHPDYCEDIIIARNIFEKAFNNFDPLEPFERMAKAIEILSKQDKRFQ